MQILFLVMVVLFMASALMKSLWIYFLRVQMIFELVLPLFYVQLIFVLAQIAWSFFVLTLFLVMVVFFMASVLVKFLWVYFFHVQLILVLVLPSLFHVKLFLVLFVEMVVGLRALFSRCGGMMSPALRLF